MLLDYSTFFSYFTLIQRLLKFPVIEILLTVTFKQHFVYKTTSMGILEDTFTSCYLPLAASNGKRSTRIYGQVVECSENNCLRCSVFCQELHHRSLETSIAELVYVMSVALW